MNTSITNVEEYLASTDEPKRAELERIRQLVKQTVPEAQELLSYGLPAFKYKGQPLLYYGAFKHHLSLFPTSGPTEELKDKLTAFRVTKGTIQFTLEKPVTDALIKELLTVRMASIDG